MPATELINAGVGKSWVIVQSLFKRSMGNLAVALQIRNVLTGVVPPKGCAGFPREGSIAVEMHTGDSTRGSVGACGRVFPPSLPWCDPALPGLAPG